jgi:integrase
LNLGVGLDGKQKRKYYSCRSKAEADRLIADLLTQLHTGTYAAPSKLTVAAYAKRWLAHVETYARPATYVQYDQMLRLYLLPALGGTKLTDLAPLQIQDLYTTLARNPGQRGRIISPTTARDAHAALHTMMAQAVKWQLLARNPADGVDPPRSRRDVRTVWRAEDVAHFLGAAEGHYLFAAFHIALLCGLRRGEILGLRWEDVDFETGLLYVKRSIGVVAGKPTVQEPKTPDSVRVLPLSPATVAVLRRHKARQAEERLIMGQGGTEWMFRSRRDNSQNPRTLIANFARIAAGIGLPHMTFHGCRHVYASLLANAGTHPKIAMQLLGHSTLSMTLHYTHGSEAAMRDAQTSLAASVLSVAICSTLPRKVN